MKNQVTALKDLAQLDVDAVGAYEAAIKHVHVESIRSQLRVFQQDHVRHIAELNTEIVRLGDKPVQTKPDIKGAVLKGFTAVTSMMGTMAALTAMMGNEKLTNRSYKAAMEKEWDPSVRQLIEKNYSDERRHLGWIKDAMKNRTWEAEAGAHP